LLACSTRMQPMPTCCRWAASTQPPLGRCGCLFTPACSVEARSRLGRELACLAACVSGPACTVCNSSTWLQQCRGLLMRCPELSASHVLAVVRWTFSCVTSRVQGLSLLSTPKNPTEPLCLSVQRALQLPSCCRQDWWGCEGYGLCRAASACAIRLCFTSFNSWAGMDASRSLHCAWDVCLCLRTFGGCGCLQQPGGNSCLEWAGVIQVFVASQPGCCCSMQLCSQHVRMEACWGMWHAMLRPRCRCFAAQPWLCILQHSLGCACARAYAWQVLAPAEVVASPQARPLLGVCVRT
jgi:hypothetical protein